MRKLATVAIAYTVAVYAANFIIPFEWLVIPALVVAVLGATLFVVGKKSMRLCAATLIFFSLGLVSFYLHSNATVQRARQFDGQTHRVEATVLTYPEIYDDYCRFEVRVTSYYLPNLRAYLYDNDMQIAEAKPGDRVQLSAKVSAADSLYGEDYRGYYANGIYLKLSSKGDIRLERGGFDIFNLPQHISHWLSSRIERIFPADTQVFMRSLMIGDTSDFYEDEELYVAMSRSGLMHVVSVSGMHTSFLVSLLYHIFGRGKRSALVCITIVWFFALVTGAGPTVVRASFMCSTLLLAPVLRRENDPVTSLSVILALILCVNPYAAASISLQLSFGAMAGIVCVGGKIYKAVAGKIGNITQHKLIRDALVSVSSSLSVMVFTVPLTTLHFGTVPLLSPLTNLISLWAVSACFCGGWISCALSAFPFAGEICAWFVSWLARYIIFAAELISALPFATLYVQTRGTWLWMGISYALFAVFAIFGKSALISYVVPGLMSIFLLASILVYNDRYYEKNQYIKVLDVGQGQCVTVLTDEVTAVLDCGNINSIDDAGTMAAAHLYSCGRDTVDILFLSHLHADHADGAATLMETINVRNLYLPADCDDSDVLYADIVECANRNGTDIFYIGQDSLVECGDIRMEIYKTGEGEDENERCLIARLDVEGVSLLLTADATARMQRGIVGQRDFSDVDVLMVSHHGSRYSVCEELLEELGGSDAIISVGHNYYGHPAEETLEALAKWGYNVHRTDVYGNIGIEIGK